MRVRIFHCAGVVAMLLAHAVAAATPLLPARIARAAHDRVAAGEYPALVIAAAGPGGAHVYAFGKLDDNRTADADSVFEIGSVTKTFTATLLANAVRSGHASLDEPVAKLLPDFTIPSRSGRSITLENLADQHSGLPRLPTNMHPAAPENPYADYGPQQLKAFLGGYQLTRNPGSAYEYSNLGEGLLGFALAHHAHRPYGVLVAKRILGPLDMRTSGAELTEAMRGHLAPGHDASGKPVHNWDFDALAGAGAIKSSGRDMLRYLRANMGLLHTPLYPAMRLAQRPRMNIGNNERIGLAWMTRHDADGDVVWHNGMTGGYASFLGFRTDRKLGVVVLTNIAQSVDDLGFATLLADQKLAPVQTTIHLPPKSLDDYVGSYQLAPHFVLTIFRQGDQLFGQATGQSPAPIFPRARNEFFYKIVDAQIHFKRNAAGAVTGLVLHQNGDHPATRISSAQAAKAASGKNVVSLPVKTLHEYVGKYRLAPGAVFDITLQGDQLSAQLTGQPAFPVYASAKDAFFYTVVDAQIHFERNATGHVTALVLHQNGADHRAPRLAH